MNMLNFNIPDSVEISMNNIPHIIAPVVMGIDIIGLIAQFLEDEIVNNNPAIKPRQLPATLNTNSFSKPE